MIASQGWAALSGRQVRALTGIVHGPEWDAFGRSWSALGDDRYMADGGRYRRRRHAVLALTDGEVRTLPPRPHYQSRDYNSLNGGIEPGTRVVTAVASDGGPGGQGGMRGRPRGFRVL